MKKLPATVPVFCPCCGQKATITGDALVRSVFPSAFLLGDIAAGAGFGAQAGAGVGLVAGPAGGIAGTVPGAVVGALTGVVVNRLRGAIECNACGTTFKILGIKPPR